MDNEVKEKKWTVLFLKLDQNNKTFYVQNVGYSESDFIKIFKLNKEQIEIFKRTYFNGFEKDINDNEFKALLQYCVTNLDVLGVYRINNFYNRDQAVINNMKDNVRLFWSAKGYTEITHCDINPIVDSHGGDVFNKRDYLYLLEEKIRESEIKIEELEHKYNVKNNNLNKELENNKRELENTIENNKQKIKQQNWYIEQTKFVEKEYIEAKAKLNNEIERYKKGKEYNDNLINNLPEEIKKLLEKKKSIEDYIENINKYITQLDADKRQIQNDIEIESKKLINIKNKEYSELLNEIKTITISKQWTKDEAIKRFDIACKMYLLNDHNLPEFEKTNAKNEGLSDDEIIKIIQKYI